MELLADLVSAYLSNIRVQSVEMPALIVSVHSALTGLDRSPADELTVTGKPTAAQVRKSITPDALTSFIDGKPYRSMKRHLTKHGFSPETYRVKYGLPSDYPMTAASYSAVRSSLAYSFGLGQKRKAAANTNMSVVDEPTSVESKRRGLLSKATEGYAVEPTARGRRKVAEPA